MKFILTLVFILFINFIKGEGEIYTKFNVDGTECGFNSNIYTFNIDQCAIMESCNARLRFGYNSSSSDYYLYVFEIDDQDCANLGESAKFKCGEPSTLGAIVVTCSNPIKPTNYTLFDIKDNADTTCKDQLELDTCKSTCAGNIVVSKDPVIFNGYISSFYTECGNNGNPPLNESFTCLSNNNAVSVSGYSIVCEVYGASSSAELSSINSSSASVNSSSSASINSSSSASINSTSSESDGSNTSTVSYSISLLFLLNIISLLF